MGRPGYDTILLQRYTKLRYGGSFKQRDRTKTHSVFADEVHIREENAQIQERTMT